MYMKYIHYRFLQYRVATKSELIKTNLVESDKCHSTDTMTHLYTCELFFFFVNFFLSEILAVPACNNVLL